MDIEDRAERWVDNHASENDLSDYGPGIREELIKAYLAGSAQTQSDYARHFLGSRGALFTRPNLAAPPTGALSRKHE